MKLLSEHRCPWCGEVTGRIRGPIGRYGTGKCRSCGGEYIYHYINSISWFADILLVVLLLAMAAAMSHMIFLVIYILFFVPANIFLSKISPYERYGYVEDTDIEEYEARFVFDTKKRGMIEEMKMMAFFMEKSIVTVRFTDSDGKPVSDEIFVCIEKAEKKRSTEFECDITLLPLADTVYNIEQDSIFLFYDGNDKAVGKGHIII